MEDCTDIADLEYRLGTLKHLFKLLTRVGFKTPSPPTTKTNNKTELKTLTGELF